MRDDLDSVVADRFKVLDHVPVPDTWSRVQRKVLDHSNAPDSRPPVQATEEVVTMIDVKTTDPTDSRPKRPMRVVAAGILAAAAAVVAIAFVVIRDPDDVTPTDEPSPTVTVTTPPRALSNMPGGEQFVPGTYYVDEVNGTPTPRIFLTIGAGWSAQCDGCMWQEDIGTMTIGRAVAVFADACHPSDGYHPGPVTTLEGLVAALSEQQGWAEVTAPSDISVDGYAGKAFQRTAPADMVDICPTRFGIGERIPDGVTGFPDFRSWEGPDGFGGGDYYEPGQIETLWVVDLDGTVVVISTELFPGPTGAAHPDFADAVLDSIRIERT